MRVKRYIGVASTGIFLALSSPEQLRAQPEVAAVPYVPTSMVVVNTMLSLGGVTGDDVLYDLGSGDGRIVVTAAQRLGTRGVGFEIIPWLVQQSYRNADSAGVRDLVRFETGDLFEADLSEATVVTLYLSAEFNLRLRPILLEKLRPGTRVVSHAFHMREWEPDSSVTIGRGANRATAYLWIVPAEIDGFWRLRVEGGPASTFELSQRFQKFEGTVSRGARRAPVTDGLIRGQRVEFTLWEETGPPISPLRFLGVVEEGRISGIATGPPGYGTRRWTAIRFSDPALFPKR